MAQVMEPHGTKGSTLTSLGFFLPLVSLAGVSFFDLFDGQLQGDSS